MLNLSGRRIILASNSPRRRELLAGLGIDFTVDTQSSFEESPEPGVDPARVPVDMSVGKSHGFHRELDGDEILITADTVVIVSGEVLGKPHSRNEAVEMLEKLSGRSHQVVTAVTMRSRDAERSFSVSTDVVFHVLPKENIDYYVDTYKPYDKAGAYAIQGHAALWCAGIEGCYYNIMGLPVHRTSQLLREFQ